MAKATVGAVLRLANPDVNKGFETSIFLPNSNKPLVFKWNKENKFEASIPTKITYKDDFGNQKVFRENYAKELLDAYGVGSANAKQKLLEFVKKVEKDEFPTDAFDTFAAPKEVVEQKEEVTESPKETKKEKKNEK